jgi:hypothetical protein
VTVRGARRRAALGLAMLAVAACARVPRSPEAEARAAAAHWAALPTAGPLQVALLYHALSGAPPPPELAYAWPDVCGVHGEAEQAVAVRRMAPRLAEAARSTSPDRHWQVQVRQQLGPYDVARGGFRTVFRNGAVVRFEPADFCFADLRYLLAFEDGGRFSLLELDAAAALRLAQADPSRAVGYDLEVEPVGHQLEAGVPVLRVSVVRLRARDAHGAVLSDSGAARQAAPATAAGR